MIAPDILARWRNLPATGNLHRLAEKIAAGHAGGLHQGCQMVCFQTENPNLGKFWRVLQWKMMVYFMDTWSILRSFAIFYGHLV
jgi:hypothetical protein